jgi:hypothetical protein
MKWDVWAQRLVAVAILIASIALFVGVGMYSYRETAATLNWVKYPTAPARR